YSFSSKGPCVNLGVISFLQHVQRWNNVKAHFFSFKGYGGPNDFYPFFQFYLYLLWFQFLISSH
ncbi:hypothetical protein Csa_008448, partial [Cucumis sativus]